MKSRILFQFLLLAMVPTIATAQTPKPAATTKADSTDGFTIHYDIVKRVDGQNMKIMIIGGPGGGDAPEMPSTITLEQRVQVSANGAILGEPSMPLPKELQEEELGMTRMIIRPTKEVFSMDFAQKTLARTMTSQFDPENKTYFSSEPLTSPTDWKIGKKTKKIAGLECTKATCTVDSMEYTVWYTTALPGTFSPMSKLWPNTPGVILAYESDDQSATATEINKTARVALPTATDKDAVRLTPAEMKAKRREFAEKAMPGGPGGPGMQIRKH